MKLILDIGNSRLKWAFFDASTPVSRGMIDYRKSEWQQSLPSSRPDAIWVVSVAGPQILRQVEDWARHRWGLDLNPVTSNAQACGVHNAYARPQRLGVDRWTACIAAHHRGAGSVLVADAGTALTLDFVAADGHHRGGLICPGVGTMRRALIGQTQLAFDAGEYAMDWLAVDTDPAIGLGSLRAMLALLDNARTDLVPDRCLITGGEAPMLLPHLAAQWEYTPDLVLEGVNRISQESGCPYV